MSTLLGEYDAGGAHREKWIKYAILGGVAAILIGFSLYFGLRNFSKRQKLDAFIEHLQKKDYRPAYALWGCSDETPCRDYSFEKFMNDWGPESPAADAQSAQVINKATCGTVFSPTGILRVYRFAPDYDVSLWVDSGDGNIGFAPVIGRMQCTVLP